MTLAATSASLAAAAEKSRTTLEVISGTTAIAVKDVPASPATAKIKETAAITLIIKASAVVADAFTTAENAGRGATAASIITKALLVTETLNQILSNIGVKSFILHFYRYFLRERRRLVHDSRPTKLSTLSYAGYATAADLFAAPLPAASFRGTA